MATENKALGVWNGLPMWAKGVIVVGTIAGVVYAVRKFMKSNLDVEEKRDITQAQMQATQENIRPTLDDLQARDIADGLYQSMNNWSPNYDTYIGDFKKYFYKIKNKQDYFLVKKVFRKKDGYNLTEWIIKEWASRDNYTQSTKFYYPRVVANEHFKTQGIDYTI